MAPQNPGGRPDDPSRKAGSESGLSSFAVSLRKAQPYVDAVWQLLAAIALGAWGGFWLDRKLGTRPWLLVAGSMLGVATGLLAFFRVLLRLNEMDKRRDGQGPAGDG